MNREFSHMSAEPYLSLFDSFTKSEGFPFLEDNPYESVTTRVRLNETLLRLLAENCCLRLTLSRKREEQQEIIVQYALTFSQCNDNPKWHARKFLDEQARKHGISKRTLLRMLPRHLKDQARMLKRLGKVRILSNQNYSNEPAAACYQEPD